MNKHFLSVLSVLIAGCHGYSAPEETVGTAYKSIQDDDLKTYISTLRDEALKIYGNEEGMCHFQKMFLGRDTRLERATATQVEYDSCGRESEKTYLVPISGRHSETPSESFQPLLRLTVICENNYDRGGGTDDCHNSTRKTTVCQISWIES